MSADRHHRDLRPYLGVLRAEGLELVDVRRSKHWRVQVEAPNGARFWLTLPVSPSCHRTLLNLRRDVRRELARVGAIDTTANRR